MADVFISYSKADRGEIEKLASYLQSCGWTVWWDRNLSAGDEFRDEIMRQLGVARAVIVVWSATSVGSKWVRSEAGRAQAQGKIVPVRMADVTYEAIPPPFDTLHTEELAALELIHGAVVAQLAKPAEQAHWASQSIAYARFHLLTWAGMVGAALTLLGNIKSVVTLADWADIVVSRWHEWTSGIWNSLLAQFGISVDPYTAASLTFCIFILSGAYSARRIAATESTSEDLSLKTFFWNFTAMLFFGGAAFIGLKDVALAARAGALMETPFPFIVIPAFGGLLWVAARSNRKVFALAFLLYVCTLILAHPGELKAQAEGQGDLATLSMNVVLIYGTAMVAASIAPLSANIRRLVGILGIIVIAIGLSELSKSGWTQYLAPAKPGMG